MAARRGATVVACLLSVSCTSFQAVADAPAPRESIRVAAAGGVVTLIGRPRSDSSRVVTCHASQVIGRFVAQRGDTTVLREAYAVSPQEGSSGHCRFRIDGEVFGASGYVAAVTVRRFSAARTLVLVGAVGAIAVAISTAEWEYASPPSSGGSCLGFFCVRAPPAAPAVIR